MSKLLKVRKNGGTQYKALYAIGYAWRRPQPGSETPLAETTWNVVDPAHVVYASHDGDAIRQYLADEDRWRDVADLQENQQRSKGEYALYAVEVDMLRYFRPEPAKRSQVVLFQGLNFNKL
jgi:hypothetical protein